ncbi:MAG: peptidase M28, partial [Solirubrobacteraceae bacterium]
MSTATAVPDTLREVVQALAAIERRAGSEGEREAAEWIARRLRAAGCESEVQPEQFLDGYAGVMSSLSAISLTAGVTALALRPARWLAGAVAAAAAAATADDVSNGPGVFRRLSGSPKTNWNVV